MNNVKVLIFDMDDTLLNDRREVSPYTLEILQKVQAMGHKLVCNTARSKEFNQKYFEQIRPDYAILNGGALIIDRNETAIFRAEVDVKTTQALLKDLLERTETIYVQTVDCFYSHKGRKTVQKAESIDFSKEEFLLPAQKIVTDMAEVEWLICVRRRVLNHNGATSRRCYAIVLVCRQLTKTLCPECWVEREIQEALDYIERAELRSRSYDLLANLGSYRLRCFASHLNEWENHESVVALELLASLLNLNLRVGNLAIESLYGGLYHA